jgi:hypothetical protein
MDVHVVGGTRVRSGVQGVATPVKCLAVVRIREKSRPGALEVTQATSAGRGATDAIVAVRFVWILFGAAVRP